MASRVEPCRGGESENILEVRGLKVWFPIKQGMFSRRVGTIKAVDGLSFELRRGETLGIVGESGSGKTTIARVVTGLQKPTEGSILLNGKVAMVFQDSLGSLNPRMTVRDAIGEVVESSNRRIVELLEAVGLDEGALDKYPHELSGGERQRVCIARALAAKPDLLICDEAVSALDLSIRARMLGLLGELKRQSGLAMMFITHDLGVAQHLADRIVVLRRGKIIEEGPCGRVLKAPREEFTDI